MKINNQDNQRKNYLQRNDSALVEGLSYCRVNLNVEVLFKSDLLIPGLHTLSHPVCKLIADNAVHDVHHPLFGKLRDLGFQREPFHHGWNLAGMLKNVINRESFVLGDVEVLHGIILNVLLKKNEEGSY